jgi:hypothetical protein
LKPLRAGLKRGIEKEVAESSIKSEFLFNLDVRSHEGYTKNDWERGGLGNFLSRRQLQVAHSGRIDRVHIGELGKGQVFDANSYT